MLPQAHFTKKNESFRCLQCGALVEPHPTSSRDHCTECLYSLHVDSNPGDRQNTCKGLMEPIGIDQRNGKTQIVYRCQNCKKMHKNIAAADDNQESIDMLATFDW